MRLPGGALYGDNPAYPLLQTAICYYGVTSADGNALGTTLVCADLDNHPSYVGNRVKVIMTGAWGQDRQVMVHAVGGILTVDQPFTDAAGAVEQITAGTTFIILTNPSGGSGGSVSPSVGLWMFGVCDPATAGSTTNVFCPNLASLPDDIFNDDFYVEVLRNDNNIGLPPEHEIRLITDYVGATGGFVVDAFSANVEADDLVAIIHHSLIGPELNLISTLVRATFDIINASLITTETGGTLTADGTEQTLYINNAPASVYEPLRMNVDLSNMAAGDNTILRVYYRIAPGGNLRQSDELTLNGAQDPPLRIIDMEPNRYGVQVTLEQTAGVNRDYDWNSIYRG